MAADGQLYELWWLNGRWHDDDVTAEAGAPPAANDGTGPDGYVFGYGQHVDYVGVNGDVYDLWWDGAWHATDLTAATGAPGVACGTLDGYVFNRRQHVNYVSTAGDVEDLWWDGTWHVTDITALTRSPPAICGTQTGYGFPSNRTQHVDYVGTNSDVYELWWRTGWQANDLRTATRGVPAAAARLGGYVFGVTAPHQHVDYVGTTGHVYELFWDGSWHVNDLTVLGIGVPTGTGLAAFPATLQQHIAYVGANRHAYDLAWGVSCPSYRPFAAPPAFARDAAGAVTVTWTGPQPNQLRPPITAMAWRLRLRTGARIVVQATAAQPASEPAHLSVAGPPPGEGGYTAALLWSGNGGASWHDLWFVPYPGGAALRAEC